MFTGASMCRGFLAAMVLVWAAAPVTAEECREAGKIAGYEGAVKVQKAGGVRRVNVEQAGTALCEGDMVLTFAGKAVVVAKDGSHIVLDPDSSLTMLNADGTRLESGKGLFEIKKRTGASGYAVNTPLSVIGVRGTRFLVDVQSEDMSVVLQEGRVDVSSLEGEFEHYRETSSSEFEKFSKRHQAEFEKFRNQQQLEFIGYVQSVGLDPGEMISISGHKAVQAQASEEGLKDLERLKAFAAASLKNDGP